ncbi:MAG: hypothetical protein NEHIOOID_00454 [Holosporales bacterium]
MIQNAEIMIQISLIEISENKIVNCQKWVYNNNITIYGDF